MKKDIFRNVAIVTAIFMVSLSTMLITNYFQVRSVTPLQTEVVETLKQLNDQHPDNAQLQEQIRQLDLLARKAYFIQADHLKVGVYILLGMVAVFVVCLRFYFLDEMHIPDKDIDPIDEWLIKSQSRKYILRSTIGLVIVVLIFAFLSSPYLQTGEKEQPTDALAEADGLQTASGESDPESIPGESVPVAEAFEPGDTRLAVVETTIADSISVSDTLPAVQQEAALPAVSSVTHNGFRGNNSNGISSAKNVPVKWNLENGTNVAWKKEIPRKGYNSPVIHGNHVFFTGADEQARELFCYDLTTGEQRWVLAATGISGSPSTMPKVTQDTGLAASTVVTNGKQVCAIFATGDVLCADMDGKRIWAKNLGVPDNHYGFASSLLIFGNLLIVQYDNNTNPQLMALDVTTGNLRWSKPRSEKTTWSSPIIAYVDKKPQLVVMGNPTITGYNPNSGEQLWQVECLSGEVGASPCSANGMIFGASEYAKLVAIDGKDGNVVWESSEYLPEVSSPVATKDHVYVATSYGVLASYDVRSGSLTKEHELNTEFYSSPMIVDGKLYIFSNDGKMHIFSTDSEFKLLDAFETGERTFATPAFTDGKIVVRTEESIYCVAVK